MPLPPEQARLFGLASPSLPGAPDAPPDPKQVLPKITRASRFNPDGSAALLKLAKPLGMSLDFARKDEQQLKEFTRALGIDVKSLQENAPNTYDYLSDEEKAAISFDDVGTLAEIERAWGRRYTSGDFLKDMALNLGLGIDDLVRMIHPERMQGERFGVLYKGAGERLGFTDGSARERLTEGMSPQIRESLQYLTEDVGYLETVSRALQRPAALSAVAARSVPAFVGITGATRSFALGLLKKEGIQVGTSEAATFLAQPHIAGRIAAVSAGTEGALSAGSTLLQAEEEGVPWSEVILPSILTGAWTTGVSLGLSKTLPGGDVEATLGRSLAGRGLAGRTPGFLRATGRTLGAGAKESLEEQIQSFGEQIGQNIVTGRPWSEGLASNVAIGGLVGFGTGTGAGAITEISSLGRKVDVETRQAIQSIADQSAIDRVITLAQQSKTAGRAPEAMAEFLASLRSPLSLYAPAEVVSQLPTQYLPAFAEQIAANPNGDVQIPTDLFVNQLARDPEAIKVLREHLKVDPMAMSRAELAAGESAGVRRMVEEAAKAKETHDEASAIMEQISEQLRATGILRPEEATYSSVLIPAYLTTKAEELKKREAAGTLPRGTRAPTVRQLYEDFFNIRIEGPATARKTAEQIDAAGLELEQMNIELQDQETGDLRPVEALPALAEADNRVGALQQLLDCLRA